MYECVGCLTFSATFQAPKRNGDVDKRNLNMSLFLRGDFPLSFNCLKLFPDKTAFLSTCKINIYE